MQVINTPENKKKSTITFVEKFSKIVKRIPNYKILDHKKIIVPRGIKIENPLAFYCNRNPTPINTDNTMENISLRENQKELLNWVHENYKKDKKLDCCIIRDTAYGKTILSLSIIKKLQLKTLIVVNKIELLKQWVKVLQEHNFKNVGTIQGKNFDIDKDIIVATVQSISLKENLSYKDFKFIGLLLIDECHTVPSDKFINLLFQVYSPVRIGLTATPEREDYKHHILFQHLPIINSSTGIYHTIEEMLKDKIVNKKQSTNVIVVKTGFYPEETFNDITGQINFSKLITDVSLDSDRNDLILQKILKMKESHKILVISDRVSQLKWLYSQIKDSQILIGKMKDVNVDNFSVILASSSIASTGLDIKDLNCLIFGTPKKNIVQTLGRIYRKNHEGEIVPTIVDFVDSSGILRNQWYFRKRQYKNNIEGVNFIEEN